MSMECLTSLDQFLNTKECFSPSIPPPSSCSSLLSHFLAPLKSPLDIGSLSGQGQRCHLAVTPTSQLVLFCHVSSEPALCTHRRREQILPQLQKAPAIHFPSEVNPQFSTPESANRLHSKKHKCHHYDNPLQSFRQRNECLSGTRHDNFGSPVYGGACTDLYCVVAWIINGKERYESCLRNLLVLLRPFPHEYFRAFKKKKKKGTLSRPDENSGGKKSVFKNIGEHLSLRCSVS